MNKQNFLAMSLPHELKVICVTSDLNNSYIAELCSSNYNSLSKLPYYKPIIRHPDDLVKECVQADYNDGKPFIPIVEILKMSGINNFYIDIVKNLMKYGDFIEALSFEDGLQLIKWHFAPNLDDDVEVVYVTEEFNPYK